MGRGTRAAFRLELAQQECESDHLDSVERAHSRIAALIDDLLTLARNGDRVDDLEAIAIDTLTERCWQTVDTADATLHADTDLRLEADRNRLRQLLENLVRNAIEHAGREVTISLGAIPDGFYLADDGPGIPDDRREAVFDAGFLTADRGTGFGLNIVDQIASAHGWEVALATARDGGTRVEITGVTTVE